jgi:hypothetical protein
MEGRNDGRTSAPNTKSPFLFEAGDNNTWTASSSLSSSKDIEEALGLTPGQPHCHRYFGKEFRMVRDHKGHRIKMTLIHLGQIVVNGRIGRIRSVMDQDVVVKVYWLPALVDDGVLKELLSPYGIVFSVERERSLVQGLKHSLTLVRRVIMRVQDPGNFPSRLFFFIEDQEMQALCHCPGQIFRCLRCQPTGHFRRECNTPLCEECHTFGHTTHEPATVLEAMTMVERFSLQGLPQHPNTGGRGPSLGQGAPAMKMESENLTDEPWSGDDFPPGQEEFMVMKHAKRRKKSQKSKNKAKKHS